MGAPEPQRLRYPVFSNGKSRGFAWATFQSAEIAHHFVRVIHDQHLPSFTGRKALACLPYNKTLGWESKGKSVSSGLPGPASGAAVSNEEMEIPLPFAGTSSGSLSSLSTGYGGNPSLSSMKSRNKMPVEYRSAERTSPATRSPLIPLSMMDRSETVRAGLGDGAANAFLYQ